MGVPNGTLLAFVGLASSRTPRTALPIRLLLVLGTRTRRTLLLTFLLLFKATRLVTLVFHHREFLRLVLFTRVMQGILRLIVVNYKASNGAKL
jgi:hypothetical protein